MSLEDAPIAARLPTGARSIVDQAGSLAFERKARMQRPRLIYAAYVLEPLAFCLHRLNAKLLYDFGVSTELAREVSDLPR